MKKDIHLSEDQTHSLEVLNSGENVFLTGGAGSGKSFLIKYFMNSLDSDQMPILASTGAAAVLLGGRTFHSFFGLGIMEGGPQAVLEKALKNGKVLRRLKKVEGIIIDEVSMIPGDALMVAEIIAKKARESDKPWGGLRIIAVGDFAQLPPVTKAGQKRDWCFESLTWKDSNFVNCQLKHNQRVKENEFLDVLADIRMGKVTEKVVLFLQKHLIPHDPNDSGTRLFPRRDQSEQYNQKKLDEIPADEVLIDSIYLGDEKHIEYLMKSAPVPVKLKLKVGCRVMFLQNDPQLRWVNGTQGNVTEIEIDRIHVKKDNGRQVQVDKSSFALQDADGNTVASVIQFPLNLAYATTIHKSQGATLDKLWCDISRLWEPGHAYVALSRLRSSDGLKLIGWNPRSIIVDPKVIKFYQQFQN